MAKQQNSTPQKPAQPAASGTGSAKTIGTKPIRTFNGPSLTGAKVGPKNAPYYQK